MTMADKLRLWRMERRRKLASLALLALIAIEDEENQLRNKIRRRNRRWWVHPWLLRRGSQGFYANLVKELTIESPHLYKNFLRMDIDSFNYLLDLVKPHIERSDSVMRTAIHAGERLAITLRFLATGESFVSLAYAWRVHKTTISAIVLETCKVLYSMLQPLFMQTPRTSNEWVAIANEFEERWNLPNCIGALDGKHIKMNKPANSGATFINYKGTFSIVLMGLVDADYRFLYVDVGCNGRVSDGGVFNRSTLNIEMNKNSLGIPPARLLPGSDVECPFYIVADDAFALRKDIMKPFPFRNMSKEERIYNYRISRGRRIVENVFGILAQRFRFLQNCLSLQPVAVENMVLASCALHNFLRSKSSARVYLRPGDVDLEDLETHEVQEGAWRSTTSMDNIQNITKQVGSITRHPEDAKQMRLALRDYFNSSSRIARKYD